ncbi:unnamed protein product [Microthlaspi erraticum]|uniref:F-box domain-containing protein n=1 Tax=Microthlaspi erraticum TaxID=1685480 RepID=A0A6D2JTP0_9BRAS|nr:unnamed protein product [Microthlaspi erraticum]
MEKFEHLSITSTRPKWVRKYPEPIPVIILMNIFSRLEGKSIARFSCVSKLWRNILRRPDFTELFLTKSSTRPRLFFTLATIDDKFLFYSSPQPQNLNEDCTLVATRYHKSFPEYFRSGDCSTACGLAFLHSPYKTKMHVVCNPITGEFLALPKLTLSRVKAKSKQAYKEKTRAIFLGYDPISKQFKVLSMASSRCKRANTHQVLTMEPGKRLWRRVECKFHFKVTFRIHREICINGVLYFGAEVGEYCVIVCFDVRSEKLGLINMSKDMIGTDTSYEDWRFTLFNYKGKLGVRQKTYWDRELVLWVLEDAASHQWSKQTYALPPISGSRKWNCNSCSHSKEWFVGMTGTGEIVFSAHINEPELFRVHFYNLERKTFTKSRYSGA